MKPSRILRLTLAILVLFVAIGAGVIVLRNANPTQRQAIIPTQAISAVLPTGTIQEPVSLPTIYQTNTPGPTLTPSKTPPSSPTPSNTPIPSLTPTRQPQVEPTLNAAIAVGTFLPNVPTPETPIPTAVPTFEIPADTTNILLLGSDTPIGTESRTDTILIVAINRDGPTASIVSLPRDLFVYIPGSVMDRINTALARGDEKDYEGGGINLLKQTILYNFGIPIHYYARVDFEGFKDVVDLMGGVEIAISCRLQDWRLKSPDLDINDEDNWEKFALEPGIHLMDGDLALWYARSRLSSSDFHRGRRQQQLLRAMLNQGVALDLIPQVPALWNTFQDKVDTDMDIGLILQLAALAPAIRENGVQHLYMSGKVESWIVPSSGAQVLLPIWTGDDKVQETLSRLFLPPALSRANRAPIFVELINTTDNPDLPLLAADNLASHGFVPIIGPDAPQAGAATQISYYAANFKGSYDWLISWIFNIFRSNIALVTEETDYPYDYKVILGNDYDPCVEELFAPQAFLNQ